MLFKSIDIFCHVVDNFGDVGVVSRFAKEFKRANPRCRVRVFIDDCDALHCIHPGTDPAAFLQEHDTITYISSRSLTEASVANLGTAEVLVEAFACHIPEIVLDAASKNRTYIINLDHLSAEKWVEGYHLKESLLGRGELKKYFFMPGFTVDTGGIIIDTDIENARSGLREKRIACLNDFLSPFSIVLDNDMNWLVATIFTYERRFDALLEALASLTKRVYLLVFDRKSKEGMRLTLSQTGGEQLGDSLYRIGNTVVVFMPFLAQHKYDELMCLCDFNIVRGEDTFVRAILSEKPFIWHAYKQDNNYQLVKVKAFLNVFRPYFEDEEVFTHFDEMLMQFNDDCAELILRVQYDQFLINLNKIKHATEKMSYFIRGNCSLISKFVRFLDQLP
jgi:uncharacterized repeat protein (TIGR03837 family)